jgi:hypothetical protein
MKFEIVLGLLASVKSFSGVIFSNTADLAANPTNHKI